jgi:phosphatidylserine/phosphatidylglycerophosphate/cardiolipin synthase-like enzyme
MKNGENNGVKNGLLHSAAAAQPVRHAARLGSCIQTVGRGTLAVDLPHDIVDNRETHLADVVRSLLGQSVRAHFAVGRFFLSGFKAIAKGLDKLAELRLLIGNTWEGVVVEQLAEARASRDGKVREQLEQFDRTAADHALVKQLVRLISEGRLKVKLYTGSRMDTKAYIFDYPTDRFEKGVGIVGISNLSVASMADNRELNVIVRGNTNHEQLVAWYNGLWNEAEPFEAELMNGLNAESGKAVRKKPANVESKRGF